MEKMKRENRVLGRVAELFDLPADLVAGLPHVELIGSEQFYMEHHRGILSYSEEEISVNAERFIVRICGEKLELVAMTGDALRIRGRIHRVEWVE